MSLPEYARDIKVTTFITQVHDDERTKAEDVQTSFVNIPVEDKKLVWTEGTLVALTVTTTTSASIQSR